MSPLWKKAPFVLLRFPGLLAALVAGALLVSLAVAAFPLFISATTSELIDGQISQPLVTRYGVGMSYQATRVPFALETSATDDTPLYLRRGELFAREAERSPYLGPTIAYALGPTVSIAGVDTPSQTRLASLFAANDVLDHVEILEGQEGSGVWLPDHPADVLGIRPGDSVALRYGDGPAVDVRVDGIYRALFRQPITGYWLAWGGNIYPRCIRDCPIPPQFVLASQSALVDLATRLGQPVATFRWTAPLAPGLHPSFEQLEELERFVGSFEERISHRTSYLGRVMDCCRLNLIANIHASQTNVRSLTGDVVDEVDRHTSAIEAPARLLDVAGVVVALLAVGLAGSFSFATRRTEANVLFVRGMSPIAVGLKTCLESLLPCLIGAAVGLALAFGLVGVLGPNGAIAGAVRWGAVRDVGLAVLAALALLGVVSAAAFPRRLEHRPTHLRVLAAIPLELTLLGIAWFSFGRLDAVGALVADATAQRPSMYIVLFPISFIGGVGALAARGFVWATRAARARSGRLPSAPFLAVHRVAGRAGLATLLVAAASLCLGASVYAQAVGGSLETTVEAKAGLFVGSDAQARVERTAPVPEDFPLPITRVERLVQAGTMPNGARFDLLAIDPETFAGAAYWNSSFAETPLEDLIAPLATTDEPRLAVIVAGSTLVPDSLEMGGRAVPVEVVGSASAFPGVASERPLVVASEVGIEQALAGAIDPLASRNVSTQLWVKGGTEEALQAIAELPFEPNLVLTAQEVADIPYIAAVIDTLVVLNVLAIVASALIVVVMVMYLQARQRGEAVSYALSLRMGMPDRSHRRALTIELGAMLAFSYVVGVAVALGTAVLLLPRLDPLSSIPPAPLFAVPFVWAGVVFVLLLGVARFGGGLAVRRARAARIGEVLRVAD